MLLVSASQLGVDSPHSNDCGVTITGLKVFNELPKKKPPYIYISFTCDSKLICGVFGVLTHLLESFSGTYLIHGIVIRIN